MTVRSSAWFGARCRLVYFIIDLNRSDAERSAGTVFSLRSRRTTNRRISYLFGIGFLTSIFLLLFTASVYKFIDLLILIRIFHIIGRALRNLSFLEPRYKERGN